MSQMELNMKTWISHNATLHGKMRSKTAEQINRGPCGRQICFSPLHE